jgi:hypothetical protein
MGIVEERGKSYDKGDPTGTANLARIAALWTAYLGVEVTARDVCWLMVLLKSSRFRQDGGANPDNILDAAGYLTLVERFRP